MSLQDEAKEVLENLDKIRAIANGAHVCAENHHLLGSASISWSLIKIVEPPRFIPWESVEDMGEAVNDWFRIAHSGGWCRIASLCNHGVVLASGEKEFYSEMFKCYKHTATPWLEDSWKPCGKEVKP